MITADETPVWGGIGPYKVDANHWKFDASASTVDRPRYIGTTALKSLVLRQRSQEGFEKFQLERRMLELAGRPFIFSRCNFSPGYVFEDRRDGSQTCRRISDD